MKALQEKRISLRSLWRRSLVILSIIALVFAACGDSDNGDSPGPGPGPAPRTIVAMEMETQPYFAASTIGAPWAFEGFPVLLDGFSVYVRYSDGEYGVINDLSRFTVLPRTFVSGTDPHPDPIVGGIPANEYIILYTGDDISWSQTIEVDPSGVRPLERMHYVGGLATRTYYSDEIPNFEGIELALRYELMIEQRILRLPRDYPHWRFSHINEAYGPFLAIAVSTALRPINVDDPYGYVDHTAGGQDRGIPTPTIDPILGGGIINDRNIIYLPLDEIKRIQSITIEEGAEVVLFADDPRIGRSAITPTNPDDWGPDYHGFVRPTTPGFRAPSGPLGDYTLAVPAATERGMMFPYVPSTRDPIPGYTDASAGWMSLIEGFTFTVDYGDRQSTFTIQQAQMNRHAIDMLVEYFPATPAAIVNRNFTSINFRYRGHPVEVPVIVYTRLQRVNLAVAEGVAAPISIVNIDPDWIDMPGSFTNGWGVSGTIVVTATYQAASDATRTIERIALYGNNANNPGWFPGRPRIPAPFAATTITPGGVVDMNSNIYIFSNWSDVVTEANADRQRETNLRVLYRFTPAPNTGLVRSERNAQERLDVIIRGNPVQMATGTWTWSN